MANPNVTLRISGGLREHLEACTGPNGDYETPSEYLRDLIRRDMENKDAARLERLKSYLAEGLSYPDASYRALDKDAFKRRSRERHGIQSSDSHD